MGSESNILLHPNGEASSDKQLKLLHFAGRIMAKCLYDSVVKGSHHLLTVHFTRSLFKYILGSPISYHDFETDDPQLFKSKVHFMLEKDIDDAGLDLTFAVETYNAKGKLLKTVPLVPEGDKLAVRDSNKKRYLTLLARHRLGLLAQPHLAEVPAIALLRCLCLLPGRYLQ
jgi:E3 ubiquitin-protein ligase HUWE1